jgi:hypothetical protein
LKPKKQTKITVRSGAAEEKMVLLTGKLSKMFRRSREPKGESRKNQGTVGYET